MTKSKGVETSEGSYVGISPETELRARQRSRDVSRGINEAIDSRKRRGRPRLDPKDETAADVNNSSGWSGLFC